MRGEVTPGLITEAPGYVAGAGRFFAQSAKLLATGQSDRASFSAQPLWSLRERWNEGHEANEP
jgi:hypothetical protein